MKRNTLMSAYRSRWLLGASCLVLVIATALPRGLAYERYKNPATGSGNCATCHGDFTGSTSPKGTVFPSGDKHEMHRASGQMRAVCNLCHTSGDNRNPFLGSSTGTANNPGLGCSGCHVGPGLRAHHTVNGVTVCTTCHTNDPAILPGENVKPRYYGTPDTAANNPCNTVAASRTNENWSIGDFLGLDNDGNNLYDFMDVACGPFRIVTIGLEGNNVRIVWDTVGGRRDVVQASRQVPGTFTNLSAPLAIPGTNSVVRTNYVEVGGATNRPTRFYRLNTLP